MRKLAKRIVQKLPGIGGPLQLWWQRRHIRHFEAGLGLPQITRSFVARYGLSVLSGPFKGMRYVPQAVGSAFVPKLLGSYESELHPILEEVLQTRPRIIVDVGCAEGYYAVGLARTLPDARVWAFDINAQGRQLCAAMALQNGVAERVEIGGECGSHELNSLLSQAQSGEALVVCDCEGCEYALLRLESVPRLKGANLLIELHPSSDPASPAAFLRDFESTHHLTLLSAGKRDPFDYEALDCLSFSQREVAINEFRHDGQQWAFLRAKCVADD